MELRLLEHEQ